MGIPYVSMRGFEAQQFRKGGDWDVFTNSETEFLQLIKSTFARFAEKDDDLILREDNQTARKKIHVDIFQKKELIFRFDIHYGFTAFKLLGPKETYSNELLRSRSLTPVLIFGENIEVYLQILKYVNYFPKSKLHARYCYIQTITIIIYELQRTFSQQVV